jgi:hypothetical protein
MKNILYFLAGVLITFIIVVIYGMGIVEQECKDAGGVLAGSTCINPTAIIEVK